MALTPLMRESLRPSLRKNVTGKGHVCIRDYAEQVTNIFIFNLQILL